MLEVRINFIPYGMRALEREIGFIKIWNDGTGTYELGNYKYEIRKETNEIVETGEFKNHRRSDSVFVLLNKILDKYNEV